jgi:uncharacterized protein (TIGR02246 family)
MKLKWLYTGAIVVVAGANGSLAVAQQSSTATGVKAAVVVPAQSATDGLSPAEAEVAAAGKKLIDAFNLGDANAVLDMFLPDAELIDEAGTVHLGKDEISALIKAFFEKYPGVQTQSEIESIRLVAGLALVDGTRAMSDKEGKSFSIIRYASIWKKTDAGYKLVSLRDINEPIPPTPKEALEELAWMVGTWVNEGTDGKVELDYRLADDGNFIIGDLSVIAADGRQVMKSIQRIAWDASEGKFRSWTFDSDGGWGEATWLMTDEGWVMQSKAVSPLGERGSAIVSIVPESADRFVIIGTHRTTEGMAEPDYEHVVVRKAPMPGN